MGDPLLPYGDDRVERTIRLTHEIVPRATHLFEEPGALERVAELAKDWFLNRLGRGKHEPLSHR